MLGLQSRSGGFKLVLPPPPNPASGLCTEGVIRYPSASAPSPAMRMQVHTLPS